MNSQTDRPKTPLAFSLSQGATMFASRRAGPRVIAISAIVIAIGCSGVTNPPGSVRGSVLGEPVSAIPPGPTTTTDLNTVDFQRNGVVVTTTPNDGVHADILGKVSGTFTHRVCNTGTTTCSAAASVNF